LERETYCIVEKKPLHGHAVPGQIEAIATTTCTYQWLHLSYSKIETEAIAIITAAQDQVVHTEAFICIM